MKTAATERLLAAALMGSLLGAAGCASTAAQSKPTTAPPGSSAEKASCKGQHGCAGAGTPGERAGGVKADGEKASCKAHSSCKGQHGCSGEGTPGQAAGGVTPK